VQATWYFRQAGRLDEAVALLAKAQASRPRDARLLLVVGENLAQLERHDEAEAAFRAALAVRPDDPGVLNALGYLNVERGVRLPEALALIEKALKLQPDNPSVLDSRGWALFKLGRLAEAERDLRRALESLPSAVVLDHLGDVLAAQGRPAEAEAAWRQALEQRDATDERRTAIQRKLEPSPPAPAPAA
jgi:Flp pilus assembly protein TadD